MGSGQPATGFISLREREGTTPGTEAKERRRLRHEAGRCYADV
ncbi:hypothetical protein BV133_1201 [Blastochloris viridis]|uniref:Uncharacterized protein n=1 Tax=Blastochloris viridis TaxID=1079 RepID=A0A182D069_BLAVI|nr:hypothetical protein BV133_1201 [Blastochloris viridis]